MSTEPTHTEETTARAEVQAHLASALKEIEWQVGRDYSSEWLAGQIIANAHFWAAAAAAAENFQGFCTCYFDEPMPGCGWPAHRRAARAARASREAS